MAKLRETRILEMRYRAMPSPLTIEFGIKSDMHELRFGAFPHFFCGVAHGTYALLAINDRLFRQVVRNATNKLNVPHSRW